MNSDINKEISTRNENSGERGGRELMTEEASNEGDEGLMNLNKEITFQQVAKSTKKIRNANTPGQNAVSIELFKGLLKV